MKEDEAYIQASELQELRMYNKRINTERSNGIYQEQNKEAMVR